MPDRPNFPIPDELTPDTFCLCLQIPNNEIWKQVFAGLLAQPMYWFNWQRDAAHSGKILSQYWTTLFDQIDWSTMSCCCDQPPAIFRYNDAGVYQRSTDGGATWENAPGFDYRNTSTTFPPPGALGIDTTKCQNADSAVHVINNDIIQALDDSSTAAQILALIAGVLLAILSAGSLAALTPLITAIGSAIIGVGVAATKAAITEDVLNRLRCNIFNHMVDDSSTDAAGFAAILARITTDESGIAETVLYNLVNAAGVVGLNNMIRSNKGDPDADCSGCGDGCATEWTFFNCDATLTQSEPVTIYHIVAHNTGHVAFTSGDQSIGCYFNPGVEGAFNYWPLGSATPIFNYNSRANPIWNFDSTVFTEGFEFDMTFSNHPLP